jgi:hypothetical protein
MRMQRLRGADPAPLSHNDPLQSLCLRGIVDRSDTNPSP